MLLEEAEGTLASLVTLTCEELEGLLAGHHLATADDATVLVLDEVLLLEPTGGVLGSTVENLGLRTDCHHLGHLIHWAAIFGCGSLRLKQPQHPLVRDMCDFAVATYAVYDADIEDFVKYYRGQGVSRIYMYVGRSYIPKTAPQGADVEYISWGTGTAQDAETDARARVASQHGWFAWVSGEERYYIARTITMAEYLATVTPSFDAVRVQAHLAQIKESGEIEYCKDGLPWSTAEKAGTISRGVHGAGGAILDSGVAKKMHILYGEEARKLAGTLYTLPACKS